MRRWSSIRFPRTIRSGWYTLNASGSVEWMPPNGILPGTSGKKSWLILKASLPEVRRCRCQRSGTGGFERSTASLAIDLATALERANQRHVVGVFEVAANRQAAGDAGHHRHMRSEQVGQVHGGRLSLEVRIGGQDHLLDPAGGHPHDQFAGSDLLRTDAVDRADGAVQHVVPTAILASPVDRQDVERLLDHADARRVAAGIGAEGARVDAAIGDVAAAGAVGDVLLDRQEWSGKGTRLVGRHAGH